MRRGVDHTRQNRGGKPIVIAVVVEVIVNEAGMKEKGGPSVDARSGWMAPRS